MRQTKKIAVVFMISLLLGGGVMGDNGTPDQSVRDTTVDDVTIELENRTGQFHFLINARGRAPPGTDHVNVTAGFKNSTTREDLGLWIEPTEMNLFLAGLILAPEGPGDDEWTEWEFRAWIDVPMDELSTTMGLLEALVGTDLPEGFEEILNTTPMDGNIPDQEKLIKDLLDSSILFIARGYDADGNYTEGEKDMKMELMNAVFSFLMGEGHTEAPIDDATDEEIIDDKKDVELIALVVIGSGIMLLIFFLTAITIMIMARKNRT